MIPISIPKNAPVNIIINDIFRVTNNPLNRYGKFSQMVIKFTSQMPPIYVAAWKKILAVNSE
jgi:hypothetical protein